MDNADPITHIAYAKKLEGRTTFRWIEIGTARIESDGSGQHNILIDRLPVGGFSGHVHLSPVGIEPGEREPFPEHPSENS